MAAQGATQPYSYELLTVKKLFC